MTTIDRSNEWMISAPCASVDPALFFPDNGVKPNAAKRICLTCPYVEPCQQIYLDFEVDPLAGVWGGKTWRELQPLRRQARARAALERAA
jgi:hypothetical protein